MMGAASIAVLVAVTGLSLFYRSCLGVIAPELTRDLGLTPEDLGNANGAFFLAMAAMQIPVGLLFDRYGPRRVVSAFAVIAVAGAAWQAMVRSPAELVAARLLLGTGCAASFMGAVTLCALWFPGGRLATVLSRVFAFSQVGTFLAATPLALAEGAIGWRWAFGAVAALTAAVGVLFYVLMRDRPPGASAPPPPTSFAEVVRGLASVWRTKGLLPVLAVHTFAYASMATVLGLWAGPYLAHVHGMDGATRGNVLLAMAAAQLVGILAFGPLDRIFDTRKWVIVPGALATVGLLGALALVPGISAAAAVTLLILFTGVTSYSVVIVAHGRSLFPDSLLGRGVTTVNIAQVVGLTVLPLMTGPIVGAFPAPSSVSPEIAYRAAFGAIALTLAAGLAVYLTARDARPSAGPPD
jgi:MFS family permease